MELWNNVLTNIEKRISHQNFDIWFKPTSLHEQDLNHNKLFVRVPNKHFKYWLAEKLCGDHRGGAGRDGSRAIPGFFCC